MTSTRASKSATRAASVRATLENSVNSSADLIKLVEEEVVFLYDPRPDSARYQTNHGYNVGIIFRLQM